MAKAFVTVEVPDEKKVVSFLATGDTVPHSKINHHSSARVKNFEMFVVLEAEYGGLPIPNLRGTHEFRYQLGCKETFYSGNSWLHALGIRKCTKVTMIAVPDSATIENGKLVLKKN
ncbi:hypothetical protein KBC75_00345 [Candidatus Shapirobacteria bacterium]|nr:hypothetical protein [Candidatus Shapirobacteria bacterium]